MYFTICPLFLRIFPRLSVSARNNAMGSNTAQSNFYSYEDFLTGKWL